jgi:ribose transport system substrate-binding protein
MKITNTFLARLFAGAAAVLVVTSVALAQSKLTTNTTQELEDSYNKALAGKTIAWVPMAMGLPLTEGWTREMKWEAEQLGMKFQVRDPNWSTSAMTQVVESLIQSKPDVLVVHNPNVQLLARQLKKAQEAGIYVVQLNMVSNEKTDAFVGGNWRQIGHLMAEDAVKACGKGSGKSGKVAVIQGELASDVAIQEMEGINAVFQKSPDIKVVVNQAAGNWDANKAREVTAAAVRQHTDLCAIISQWGPMAMGSGQAVKAAGMGGKVAIYSTGENPQMICDAIHDDIITKYWNVDNLKQGRDVMTTVKYLLQMKQKPGTFKVASYSPIEVLTKANSEGACWK